MSGDDFNLELLDDEEQNSSSLTASGIAEYIRFNCCPRFFKLKFEGKEVKKTHLARSLQNPSAPCSTAQAKRSKKKKVAELKAKADHYLDFTKYDPQPVRQNAAGKKAADSMNNLHYIIESQIAAEEEADGRPVLIYQVPMKGPCLVFGMLRALLI